MSKRNKQFQPWKETPAIRAERVANERASMPRAKNWSQNGEKLDHRSNRRKAKIDLNSGKEDA